MESNLEDNHTGRFQHFTGLPYGFIIIQSLDLMPTRELTLGRLIDLESYLGQKLEEGVVESSGVNLPSFDLSAFKSVLP
jgi:hypothetical protein